MVSELNKLKPGFYLYYYNGKNEFGKKQCVYSVSEFQSRIFLPYIITSHFLFAQFVWIMPFGHTDWPTIFIDDVPKS